MVSYSIRNLAFVIQSRCLKTSATLSPTSPLPQPAVASSFTVKFLINSCGLPLKSALSASSKLQLDEKNRSNYESVIDLFKSHGFNQSHLADLIERQPSLLLSRVEDKLRPKIDYLIENGFVGDLLIELVRTNPSMFRRALDSHIKPSLDILKCFLDSNEKIVLAVKRSKWLMNFNLKGTMQPNIDFLMKEGVSVGGIAKMILLQPRAIMQNRVRMVYAVNAVKNLGFEPSSLMFVHAVRVMTSMKESTLKRKIELMQSYGWSKEEIFSAFKRYPLFLSCSEEKLRRVVNFCVNTMKLEPQTIISYPPLLMYGLETRIRPRYNVLKILESNNLIKEGRRIDHFLSLSNQSFLNKYVTKYMDKVPGLFEIYSRSSKAVKIDT